MNLNELVALAAAEVVLLMLDVTEGTKVDSTHTVPALVHSP